LTDVEGKTLPRHTEETLVGVGAGVGGVAVGALGMMLVGRAILTEMVKPR
jgi:hypothetical protein